MIALTTGQWQKTLSKCCILDEGVDDGMFVVCWITSTCFFMYMRTESLHNGVNFTHTHTHTHAHACTLIGSMRCMVEWTQLRCM